VATKPGARLSLDNLTFHEAVPGHYFQIAIAMERQRAHPLTRYLDNAAFIEGWGIYAETLAGEMGLYASDAPWLKELEDHLYTVATLVMETGMHVRGWSRQQAIDYELAHTTRSAEQAAIDVASHRVTGARPVIQRRLLRDCPSEEASGAPPRHPVRPPNVP
jgi:uncharacterized protein (DUF885 family)